MLAIVALTAIATSAPAAQVSYSEVTTGLPAVDAGSVRRYAVTSAIVGGTYTVDVWTPNGYSASGTVRYPVVYAADGQNLFDGNLAYASVAWELDATPQQLADAGTIVAPIVVGISNRGELRPNDYFPEKAVNYIADADRGNTYVFTSCAAGFNGDEYAAFVATELKPLIDELYATNPERSHTFAMGSSMGGLISLYLLCEHPEVFGAAACLSTHWIGSLNLNADYTMNDDPVCANAILDYVRANMPGPESHRIYMDQGTTGWDAGYLGYEATARQIVRDKGYSESNGTLSTYDATGAGHNEWYWKQRVDRPLKFLLAPSALAAIDGLRADAAGAAGGCYYDLLGRSRRAATPAELPAGVYVGGGKTLLIR